MSGFLKSVFILLFYPAFCLSQSSHRFEIKDGNFLYDGKPVIIHSGELHFSRVPAPYWRHRLQMMKAMGLNAVTTYVFWNYHETSPGVWDFKSENRDIRTFIKIAGEQGLLVILRPGPYACGEWEFGGYPWWLEKNKALQIRTLNTAFLDSCKTYINQLADQVKDLQITQGGPIILVQAENEFGSYVAQQKDIPLATHKAYSEAISQLLTHAGFDVPFFTSDGSDLLKEGHITGALPAVNGEDDTAKVKETIGAFTNGKGPYMVAEFYPGWLDHWREPFEKVTTTEIVNQTEKYLKAGISFNYYMIHGGTNFAFTSGANYDKTHDIQPDITSYDYDAPISEDGRATTKYDSLRILFQSYTDHTLPEPPAPMPLIEILPTPFVASEDLFSQIENVNPVEYKTPLSFEDLNQGYGYVLYRHKFNSSVSGTLALPGLRDYAILYVNGRKAGELNRNRNNYSMEIQIPAQGTLDILVENMGRINYGAQITQNLKGIISPLTIAGKVIAGNWLMYTLPMSSMPSIEKENHPAVVNHPAIYQAKFPLTVTGDSFLDMRDWEKGIVFVNGHNLGRYWNAGPQQTLYLPGCWLKTGENTIVVFEQLNEHFHYDIKSVKTPILDQLQVFNK